MSTMNEEKIQALLAGLPDDVSITRYTKHKHTIELFVSWAEPKGEDRLCPFCSTTRCVKKDGGADQTVRHVPSAYGGMLVTFHKPRFLCRSCGKTFFMKPSWVAPDISITKLLFFQIYERLTSTVHSVSEIARETLTSPSIVLNVMNHIDLDKLPSLPVSLGIDEFHGLSGYWDSDKKRYTVEKYHCAICDADNGCILDIRYKATAPKLTEYFFRYSLYERQKVKFYCTDMRPGFSKVARRCFPRAKICIDPFHVVKLLTDAISEIRVREWHVLHSRLGKLSLQLENESDPEKKSRLKEEVKLLTNDCALMKNSQRLLTTSPFNENRYWNFHLEKREQNIKRIFELSSDVEEAYDALQQFYVVTHQEFFQLQRTSLSEWIKAYRSSMIPELRKACDTIEKYRSGIENAWHYHKSNSPAEGLNKRIKDVKRLGFGAHSFENFRKRALLACGYVSFIQEPYTIFGEKAAADNHTDEGGASNGSKT